MRSTISIVAILALVLNLSACGSSSDGADLRQVLNRTVAALRALEDKLKENQITQVTDKHMGTLTGFMQYMMNANPPVYKDKIAMTLMKDATFAGHADLNKNGKIDDGEKKIFTVEIDQENKRLIATDTSGTATSYGFSGAGLLTGLLIGSLLNRQRAAGVKPGHFNNRKVTPASKYKSPRSRSRSGGLFGGK